MINKSEVERYQHKYALKKKLQLAGEVEDRIDEAIKKGQEISFRCVDIYGSAFDLNLYDKELLKQAIELVSEDYLKGGWNLVYGNGEYNNDYLIVGVH